MKENSMLSDAEMKNIKSWNKSIEKLNRLLNNLENSDSKGFPLDFNAFIAFVEGDEILSGCVAMLKENQDIDFEKWWEDFNNTGGSLIGSKRYVLFETDLDNASILYQFLLALYNEKVDFVNFCLGVYGSTNYDEMVYRFNRDILRRFKQHFAVLLEDKQEQYQHLLARAEEQVKRQQKNVASHVANFYGAVSINQSQVAIGGSSIENSNLKIETNDELRQQILNLKAQLEDVSIERQASVKEAIDLIAGAVDNFEISKIEIVQAIDKVANSSSQLKSILLQIGINCASSAITNTVALGLTYFFHNAGL